MKFYIIFLVSEIYCLTEDEKYVKSLHRNYTKTRLDAVFQEELKVILSNFRGNIFLYILTNSQFLLTVNFY